ncbi:MAG TPA: hypothetical protein DIC64_01375 [Alphaproteobacteria bacterium]|nr:hypothetical protein [Alphaproteobacteria bacterium]
MLTLLFFATFFSSLVWLIYAGLFVHNRFATVDMSSVDAYTLALYAGLVVIPVWIVWQVFGFINQYFKTKSTDKKLEQLFTQMKKNQDYTDLVVRVMLDAEHEIKDGFVVGKFDVFVADMNEILADIVQRSNAASTVKIGELWTRVKNGERWSIAKTFIENAKAHTDFEAYLKDKAERDKVFKGTLLEFCARYQNLSNLLEKHDRDRVFITILETGVMGRVYAMLAPIALKVSEPVAEPKKEEEEEKTFEVSPSIEQMEAPHEEKRDSIFKKLNLFAKKKQEDEEFSEKETAEPQSDDDAFFSALQKSMTSDEKTEPSLKNPENFASEPEPHFEPVVESSEAEEFSPKELEEHQQESLKSFLSEPATPQKEETKFENDDNLAYPFGGWTDAGNN